MASFILSAFGKKAKSFPGLPATWKMDDSDIFTLGEERYCTMPTDAEASPLPHQIEDGLVTVIPVNGLQDLSVDWFNQYKQELMAVDDFAPEFRSAILFTSSEVNVIPISTDLKNHLAENGIRHRSFPLRSSDQAGGPHVVLQQRLRQVYKLCEDHQHAFMTPVKPMDSSGSFEKLSVPGCSPQTFCVAVPSRQSLFHKNRGPLAGKRFGVKDIFDLKGIVRTANNRSYASVSPPATRTAPAIQKLIDLGASIVGTMKLNSMLAPDEPTDAVDFLAPFNPRADGYQSPAGSSSGSAAAVAAYDWLDFTIGSDTTASSRTPALANGCFQLRYTHGTIPAAGIMENFLRFDESALFGREIESLKACAAAWGGLDDTKNLHGSPTSLLYLEDYLPLKGEAQNALLEQFMAELASTVAIPIHRISIAKTWASNPPAEAAGISLYEFLDKVGRNTFYYDAYHNTSAFREAYRAKYHAEPYVNPVVRWRWDFAAKITKAERDEGVRRLDVYKEWLLQRVLRTDEETVIVILPIGAVEPKYRDAPSGGGFFIWDAWNPLWLSPILEAPEFSVPVGELPYKSKITGNDEKLPVVVSLLGPPCSDVMLMETAANCLKATQRPTKVHTGREMFAHRPLDFS